MKDIKYWCVRQECQCKAVGGQKQREYEQGPGKSQYEHWLEKHFGQ